MNWVFNNPISKSHFSSHNEWYRTYTNATYLDLFKPLDLTEAIETFERSETEGDGLKPLKIVPKRG